MEKNKVSVNINGCEYIIKGEESEQAMITIAEYVDCEIQKLTSLNSKLNPTFAAVLSALNIANDLFKFKAKCEEMEKEQNRPLEELEELKLEYAIINEENQKLKEQLDLNSNKLENNNIEVSKIKNQYEKLSNDYENKNEELSKSFREYEYIRREKENKQKELERAKIDLSECKYKLIDLQNQLLQNQIDFVKEKKEFNEFRMNYNKDNIENSR